MVSSLDPIFHRDTSAKGLPIFKINIRKVEFASIVRGLNDGLGRMPYS